MAQLSVLISILCLASALADSYSYGSYESEHGGEIEWASVPKYHSKKEFAIEKIKGKKHKIIEGVKEKKHGIFEKVKETKHGIIEGVKEKKHHFVEGVKEKKHELVEGVKEKKESLYELMKKKLSWVWPHWGKKQVKIHHETVHYPIWKIHKYEGVEIKPHEAFEHYPPPNVYIHAPTSYKEPVEHHIHEEQLHHITSELVHQDEIPYHVPHHQSFEEHEALKPLWVHEEAPVWNHHSSPDIHHTETVESSYHGDHHVEAEIPSTHKKKKIFQKLKHIHDHKAKLKEKIVDKKASITSFFKHHKVQPEHISVDSHIHHISEHEEAQHHGHYHPQPEDAYIPWTQYEQNPETHEQIDLDPAYEVHHESAEKLKAPQYHSSKQQYPEQIHAQASSQYEEQYPPYPEQTQGQLYNSYGEPIPNDSYSRSSDELIAEGTDNKPQVSTSPEEKAPEASEDTTNKSTAKPEDQKVATEK